MQETLGLTQVQRLLLQHVVDFYISGNYHQCRPTDISLEPSVLYYYLYTRVSLVIGLGLFVKLSHSISTIILVF